METEQSEESQTTYRCSHLHRRRCRCPTQRKRRGRRQRSHNQHRLRHLRRRQRAAGTPRNGSGDGGGARENWRAPGGEDLDQQRPPTSSLTLQPETPLPVDDSSFSGDQVEEILTAKLGFSFCFTDKTLDGDGGERVISRRRVRRMKGACGRAGVIGLGNEVPRRRGRCPL